MFHLLIYVFLETALQSVDFLNVFGDLTVVGLEKVRINHSVGHAMINLNTVADNTTIHVTKTIS